MSRRARCDFRGSIASIWKRAPILSENQPRFGRYGESRLAEQQAGRSGLRAQTSQRAGKLATGRSADQFSTGDEAAALGGRIPIGPTK